LLHIIYVEIFNTKNIIYLLVISSGLVTCVFMVHVCYRNILHIYFIVIIVWIYDINNINWSKMFLYLHINGIVLAGYFFGILIRNKLIYNSNALELCSETWLNIKQNSPELLFTYSSITDVPQVCNCCFYFVGTSITSGKSDFKWTELTMRHLFYFPNCIIENRSTLRIPSDIPLHCVCFNPIYYHS